MKLNFKKQEDTLIVRLDGEFDLHTAGHFKEEVEKKMDKDIKKLILNLEGIKFIDSSGLGAILGQYKKLEKKRGKMAIVNVSSQVKRIFELAGILKIIDLFSSEKEAFDNITRR